MDVSEGNTSPADFALATVQTGTSIVQSIEYDPVGGKNGDKDLRITLSVVDSDGGAIEGASVSIELFLDSGLIATGTGSTGSGGTLTFRLRNAAVGTYYTDVTAVIADGFVWDGETPPNTHTK